MCRGRGSSQATLSGSIEMNVNLISILELRVTDIRRLIQLEPVEVQSHRFRGPETPLGPEGRYQFRNRGGRPDLDPLEFGNLRLERDSFERGRLLHGAS